MRTQNMTGQGSPSHERPPHTADGGSAPISKERAAEIAAILDEAIDCSDIPEAAAGFFRRAKLVLPGARRGTR